MMRECYLILKRVLINLSYGGFLNDESELYGFVGCLLVVNLVLTFQLWTRWCTG